MGFSKYGRLAIAIGASAVSGALSGYITMHYFPRRRDEWIKNWDKREPVSTLEQKEANLKDDRQTQVNVAESTAIRHILLIRHGQYHSKAREREEKTLTTLGKKQAIRTGKRLEELNLPFTSLTRSTMIRAIQTSDFILKFLPRDLKVRSCPLLEEGAPYKPEPYNNWPSEHSIYVDGPRIESAFRKHIHRAPPEQKEDSYEIFVCHANIIRFFVCRALQLPLHAWYRFELNHGSITWLTIYPNGEVELKEFGAAGFMPRRYLTTR